MSKPYCIACDRPTGPSDYKLTIEGQENLDPLGLCLACWEKVVRGGRQPQQTIEAVLYFHNDPEVGGPADPLDHEDYRDLERLGLWPPKDDDGLHGEPVSEEAAEAFQVGESLTLYSGGRGGENNPERSISGLVTRVERVAKKAIGQSSTVEVDVDCGDGLGVWPLYTWRGLLRYGSGAQEVRM